MCDNKNSSILFVTLYSEDGDCNFRTSVIATFFTKEEAIEFGKTKAYYFPDEYVHQDYQCNFLIASEIKEPMRLNFSHQSYIVIEEQPVGTMYKASDMILSRNDSSSAIL